jgi:dienelactone hydrolase
MQDGCVWTRLLLGALVGLAGARGASAQATSKTDRLLERGPYGTGVMTIPLVDTSRATPANGSYPGAATRALTTEVWYPAADHALTEGRNAAVADGCRHFPLIVHGHGFTSTRAEIRYVAKHLSSYGYVVAAPDFPLSNQAAPGGPVTTDVPNQAADMIFVSQALVSAPVKAFAPFASHIDSTRLALSGYSLGGVTAALAANHPSVDVLFTMAPATCALFLPGGPGSALNKPTIVMSGDSDAVVHFDNNAVPFYESNAAPKFLVQIFNGSHAAFFDSAPALETAFPGVPLDALVCSRLPGLADPISRACKTCDLSVLHGVQLSASRQQDLTRATALAFFDGYLRGEARDVRYLEKKLEHENSELSVSFVDPFTAWDDEHDHDHDHDHDQAH